MLPLDSQDCLMVAALRRITVNEPRGRYRGVFGEESRSRNKQFVWKRIAWRIQAVEEGGLSGGECRPVISRTSRVFWNWRPKQGVHSKNPHRFSGAGILSIKGRWKKERKEIAGKQNLPWEAET